MSFTVSSEKLYCSEHGRVHASCTFCARDDLRKADGVVSASRAVYKKLVSKSHHVECDCVLCLLASALRAYDQ